MASCDQVGDGVESAMDDERRANPGALLLVPYRCTEDRMFRALREAGFDTWTPARCRVCQRVAPDGSRLADLADQARVAWRSAGAPVDRLRRLGCVRRVPDPTDGRARLMDRRPLRAPAPAAPNRPPSTPTPPGPPPSRELRRAPTGSDTV